MHMEWGLCITAYMRPIQSAMPRGREQSGSSLQCKSLLKLICLISYVHTSTDIWSAYSFYLLPSNQTIRTIWIVSQWGVGEKQNNIISSQEHKSGNVNHIKARYTVCSDLQDSSMNSKAGSWVPLWLLKSTVPLVHAWSP